MINKDTKMFYSVSSNPGNFGATLYNAAFKFCEIDAFYRPLKLLPDCDFGKFIETMEEIGASGVSVI